MIAMGKLPYAPLFPALLYDRHNGRRYKAADACNDGYDCDIKHHLLRLQFLLE